MNKNTEKLISSIVISTTTLIAGFIITMVSFNLFGELTANQMKILFAIDFLCLAAVGGIFLFLPEYKKDKKREKRELERKRKRRFLENEKQIAEINAIISASNYAA